MYLIIKQLFYIFFAILVFTVFLSTKCSLAEAYKNITNLINPDFEHKSIKWKIDLQITELKEK